MSRERDACEGKKNACMTLTGKPEGKRPLERPRYRYMVKMDHK
jgi:hypothetical protein